MKFKFSFIFLAVSIISFAYLGYLIWQRTVPISIPLPIVENPGSSPSATLSLSFPSLSVSPLPVFQAHLTGTRWEYTSKGVSHLSSTPWAGQTGNAVYYAHNWPNLFGQLRSIKVGDLVRATDTNGQTFDYRVVITKVVPASYTNILDPTSDSRMTLFTCTGFLDSQRFVAISQRL